MYAHAYAGTDSRTQMAISGLKIGEKGKSHFPQKVSGRISNKSHRWTETDRPDGHRKIFTEAATQLKIGCH